MIAGHAGEQTGAQLRRTLLIMALLAAGAIGVLYWSQHRPGPFYVSGVVEADDARVGSRVGGRIARVHVVEGQRVEPRQPLFELEPFDLRERRAQALAALAAREAKLRLLEGGFRPEEIAQARARVDRARAVLERTIAGPRPLEIQILAGQLAMAQAELNDAQREFERLVPLFESGDASRDEMSKVTYLRDLRQAAHEVARDRLALAREGSRKEDIAEARAALAEHAAALQLLEAGYRREEIAAAEAETEAARAELAAIDEQIRELTVIAPLAAVVDALDLVPGDLVSAGAPMVTLVDAQSLYVRAYVPENRLDIRVGQTVWLRADAFGQRRFRGHVSFVARQGEFTPANVQTREERVKQMFRIKIAIDEGRDLLRAGMAVDVFFENGHVPQPASAP